MTMLSDDVFRSELRKAANNIEHWLAGFRDVADIDVANDEASWRVGLKPHAVHACPIELVLRVDQCFDMMVGVETYEDRPIDTLALFPKLLQAVAIGKVVTRVSSSLTTATVHRVATLIDIGDGSTWTGVRNVTADRTSAAIDLIIRDQHYVPYTRSL